MNYCPTYNQVLDVADITNESEIITEPVTLEEMKNFMRLEGFSTDGTNIISEAPLALTLLEAATTVQSALLIDATILTLAREGTIYTKSSTVGNRKFTHNETTGVIAFQTAGEPGGEGIDITYGYASETGGDDAFDFDNDLIEELITSAREGLERYCGRSIVPHTWKVLLTNQNGNIELPFSNGIDTNVSGPVLDSIEDCNGDDIDEEDYKLRGTSFMILETPLQEKMTLVYSVTPTVPKRLKQAIMRDVCFHYENRNDLPGQLAPQALVLASSFKRVSTWLA